MTVMTASELTLPASWYSTKAVYELERRAIFARRWLLVTHSLRFAGTGDYCKFTIAGFPFFIIKDRDGELNAFLNACRHRAFPLILQDQGKSSILACKYHGWSYGLKGNLAKAPKFDAVPGFDKSSYSLFRVHLRVDKRGFVWVNLDSQETPEATWDESFGGVDEQPRLDAFDMSDYRFDHAWDMPGEYNWKTLIDNYNECYHCSVAHPGIAKTTNLDSYNVNTSKTYIEHYAENKEGSNDTTGTVAPTFLFPNTSITMTDKYFYLMRVVPVSETSVSMQYEVYRSHNCSDADFAEVDAFFKQVEAEDKFLCSNAQQNLNAGGYVSGPLHPYREKGVLHFKSLVKSFLYEHREKERTLGREIAPVKRTPEREDVDEEERFCADVCGGMHAEKTAW